MPRKRKVTWAEAIEVVLRKHKRPLHVREIARLVASKYELPENHQTVSEKCQRDWRFDRIAPATFDLSEFWKHPNKTIQSMITVKAGTRVGKLRAEAIKKYGHCQEPGCHKMKDLRLHHKYRKAKVFREIVKNNHLSFGPDDPIRNILKSRIRASLPVAVENVGPRIRDSTS